jgi:hypothetical protein
MTRDILKDSKGNTYRIETCKYCTDYKGQPKPILPEDLSRAIRMPDGSYKCEPCQIEETQDKIVRVTPNSQRNHGDLIKVVVMENSSPYAYDFITNKDLTEDENLFLFLVSFWVWNISILRTKPISLLVTGSRPASNNLV